MDNRKINALIKRAFDVVFSLTGIIILSPVFLVLSVMIILDSRGGVFFRGQRVGLYGKPFRIFKFRSMKINSEGNGYWNIGENDSRITRIGGFLRRSKLDELPQLFNVFLGEMSIVGPRPELQYYVDMYTEDEKEILSMKPGITDWASVTYMEQYINFTSASDPDRFYLEQIRPVKLKLQLYYCRHQSFGDDLLIVALTLMKVITKKGRIPQRVENAVAQPIQESHVVI